MEFKEYVVTEYHEVKGFTDSKKFAVWKIVLALLMFADACMGLMNIRSRLELALADAINIVVLLAGAFYTIRLAIIRWPSEKELADELESKRKWYVVSPSFYITEDGDLVVYKPEESDDIESAFTRVRFPGDAKLRKAIRDGAKVSVDVEDRFDKRGRHLMSIYTLLLEENPPQA